METTNIQANTRAYTERRLIVLDGGPGSGKTSLLQVVHTLPSSVAQIVPKLRTGGRHPKPGEFTTDYIRLADADFERHAALADFYEYRFGSDRYGVHRADIEAALASTQTAVIVIRNTALISRLQQDITTAAVVPVFLTASSEVIRERVGTDEVSVRRLARAAELERDFDPGLYRVVLRNDGCREAFEAAIHELIKPAAVAA